MGRTSRTAAIGQALLVTLLWSTSWVLIKIGLEQVPALTFAGLRYVLAFVVLVPVLAHRGHLARVRGLTRMEWLRLAALGVLFIAVTQGAQFVALSYLPAVTVNLILSLTTIVVALMGLAFLGERPGARQWGGIGLALIGAVVYFLPVGVGGGQALGLVVAGVCVLANAGSGVLGRDVNRRGDLPPLLVTTISMGFGAVLLLGGGLALQGLPKLDASGWLIIGWLAVVNTAFAFTLWNRTLRTLTAVESSVINNTMLIQIPILAVVFLGERLTWIEIAGLVLAGVGTVIVQLRRSPLAQESTVGA
jgi:drug/metabolite transporter (DMT)-like permease